MRLCDIIDIKTAFMEKTDLSEEEIQTIIDDIPTAFNKDKVIEQFGEYKNDVIDRRDAINIVEAGGINEI